MPGVRSETDIIDPVGRVLVAAVGDAVGVIAGERRDRARDAVAAVDWPAFADRVRHHGVAPLVRRSRWFTDAGAPAEVHEKLHHLARRSSARALRTIALLDELLGLFAAEEIDVLVLDGLPFTAWAHGDPMARAVGDLDVLVDPARVPDAARVLLAAGFEVMPDDVAADGSPAGVASLVNRSSVSELGFTGNGMFVDVRWRLFDNAHLLPAPAVDGRARRTVDVGGIAVPTLAAEAAWWYAVVHGTRRRWARLGWLADVPAVLATCPGLVSMGALERAEGAGVDRCVATALTVSESVFGPHLGAEARAWVASRPGAELLARHARAALADGHEGHGAPADEGGAFGVLAEVATAAQVALSLRGDRAYRTEEVRQAAGRVARELLHPAAPIGRLAEQLTPVHERVRDDVLLPAALAVEAGIELVRAAAAARSAPGASATSLPTAVDIDLTDGAAAAPEARPPVADAVTDAVAAAVGTAVGRAARLLGPLASPLGRAVAADRMLDRRAIAHTFDPGARDPGDQGQPSVRVGSRTVVGAPPTPTSPRSTGDVS